MVFDDGQPASENSYPPAAEMRNARGRAGFITHVRRLSWIRRFIGKESVITGSDSGMERVRKYHDEAALWEEDSGRCSAVVASRQGGRKWRQKSRAVAGEPLH